MGSYQKNEKLILPSININKAGKYYRIEWDDHGTASDEVLLEKSDLIGGYIGGFFDALESKSAKVICLASNTGTIDRLTKEEAEKLKAMLENVLYPFVTKRFDKIKKHNSGPEMKFQRHRDAN